MKIKRALISVSDKTNLLNFAGKLIELDIEIISTGGTAKYLRDVHILVNDISKITKFPEILEGRVNSIHPLIYGGILADRNNPKHIKDIEKFNIPLIDMVVVNVDDFNKKFKDKITIVTPEIETIDIEGPSLLRAAAKNYKYVIPVSDPFTYESIIKELVNTNDINITTRQKLAEDVFYDMCIYNDQLFEYLIDCRCPADRNDDDIA